MTGSGAEWGEDTLVGAKSPRSITLTMRQGPNPGQRFTVSEDHITIGRQPKNDVSIADKQVSRHHADIQWENNQFVIRDMGSANGTTVNGTALTGPCPLHDGDVVGLGEVILTFQGGAVATGSAEDTFIRPAPPAPVVQPPEMLPTPVVAAPQASGSSWLILLGLGSVIALVLFLIILALAYMFSQTQSGPSVTIQQPPSGSQAQVGQPVSILASASDPKGVDRVELWIDGTLNSTIASSQTGGQPVLLVQQPWTPMTGGTHTFFLKAYNTSGGARKSADITVNVGGSGGGAATPQATATTIALQQGTTVPIETLTVTPTPTVTPCTNDSAFDTDVTVPDNTIFHPGESISKAWRIRNTGGCPWESGYHLLFVGGSKMGAIGSQPVVPTAPGDITDITVTMYAPNKPGTYKGIWRMATADGQVFGQSFTVVIQVPSPDTPTPTITPTPTATPTYVPPPPPPGAIVHLTVDSDHVNASAHECTTLRASVEHVAAAWLDGEAVVGGYREKTVCPCSDTTYTLDAALSGGEHIYRSVTVYVSGSCPPSKADLAISEFSVDEDHPLVGDTTHFKLKVRNEGNHAANHFAVAWNIDPATSFWKIIDSDSSLDPGDSKWFTWTYKWMLVGTYHTQAKVDFYDNVDESDEGNNSKNLTVKPHF